MTRREVDWHTAVVPDVPDERHDVGRIARHGARGHWVIDRLAARDVRDGQPDGARLAEHFARLEFVEANYRLAVPRMLRKSMLSAPPSTAPDAADSLMLPFRDYIRWQIDFDDRGVVYMRFGKPEKVVYGTGDHARETWRYMVEGDTLLVSFIGEDFSGSVGATRLATGMIGTYMCGVDAWRCGLAMRQESGMRLNPEDIEALRSEDRQEVAYATTRDDNSARAEKTVRMVSTLHRLWDAVSDEPIALVTWALRLDDLATREQDSVRTTTVDLDLRRWDPSANLWSDTTFVPPPEPSGQDAQRRRASPDSSSFRPRQGSRPGASPPRSPSRDHLGRAHDEGPALGTGPLALSIWCSVPKARRLVWSNHGAPVALTHPLDAVDHKESLQLYYQVKSDMDRTGVKTTIALYRADDPNPVPVLEVSYSGDVHQGLTEVAPIPSISHSRRKGNTGSRSAWQT